jgi:hypothetical protein
LRGATTACTSNENAYCQRYQPVISVSVASAEILHPDSADSTASVISVKADKANSAGAHLKSSRTWTPSPASIAIPMIPKGDCQWSDHADAIGKSVCWLVTSITTWSGIIRSKPERLNAHVSHWRRGSSGFEPENAAIASAIVSSVGARTAG